MKHSVGLDISVKETAICIVDENGKVVRETKVTTEPAPDWSTNGLGWKQDRCRNG